MRARPAPAGLRRLRNLGPTSAAMLAAAGIGSEAELRRLGAVGAYLAVLRSGQPGNLNLLWTLEGALADRDWRAVARDDRLRLLMELERRRQPEAQADGG